MATILFPSLLAASLIVSCAETPIRGRSLPVDQAIAQATGDQPEILETYGSPDQVRQLLGGKTRWVYCIDDGSYTAVTFGSDTRVLSIESFDGRCERDAEREVESEESDHKTQ